MIYIQTKLKIKDNTGAKVARCIKIYNKTASLGNIILVSIRSLKPKQKNIHKIVKGGLFKALIIQTKYKVKNLSDTFINFNENNIILINSKLQPLGTRILGPIPFFFTKTEINKSIINFILYYLIF